MTGRASGAQLLVQLLAALKQSKEPAMSDEHRRPRSKELTNHPLLEGLNEEDLTIARNFHDAETTVRLITAACLLESEPHGDRLLGFIRRLVRVPDWLPVFEDLLAAAERRDVPPPDRESP